mmetsp:Transcript_25775/g.67535  ORF Transcript_25775/g.67535 Transcript_25775/m.67535 type:complete len:200 (+) Transcript_25775:5947-6546(+)
MFRVPISATLGQFLSKVATAGFNGCGERMAEILLFRLIVGLLVAHTLLQGFQRTSDRRLVRLQSISCLIVICLLILAQAHDHHTQGFFLVVQSDEQLISGSVEFHVIFLGQMSNVFTQSHFHLLHTEFHHVHGFLRFHFQRSTHDRELVLHFGFKTVKRSPAINFGSCCGPFKSFQLVLLILHLVGEVIDLLQSIRVDA